MTPYRSYHKGNHKAECYVWNSKDAIYVDDHAFEGTWEKAIEKVDELAAIAEAEKKEPK